MTWAVSEPEAITAARTSTPEAKRWFIAFVSRISRCPMDRDSRRGASRCNHLEATPGLFEARRELRDVDTVVSLTQLGLCDVHPPEQLSGGGARRRPIHAA